MASLNDIHLRLGTTGDVPNITKVMSRAFGHDAPFVDVFFPDHDTPAGQAAAIQNFKAYWQTYTSGSDLVAAVIKHQDGSEEIVGFALWTFMSPSMNLSPPELESAAFAKSEEDALFAKQLWRSYVVPRRSAVLAAESLKDGGVWVLEYLAVDPGHQGKGVGKRLVRWGLDKARKDGTFAIVEATPAGEPCYKSCGFKAVIHPMQFKVDEQFAGRRKPELAFMRNECK